MPKFKTLTKKRISKRKRNTRRIVGGTTTSTFNDEKKGYINGFIKDVQTIIDINQGTDVEEDNKDKFKDDSTALKSITTTTDAANSAIVELMKLVNGQDNDAIALKDTIITQLKDLKIDTIDNTTYLSTKEYIGKQIQQMLKLLQPVEGDEASNSPPPPPAQTVNEDNEALYLQTIDKNGKKKTFALVEISGDEVKIRGNLTAENLKGGSQKGGRRRR